VPGQAQVTGRLALGERTRRPALGASVPLGNHYPLKPTLRTHKLPNIRKRCLPEPEHKPVWLTCCGRLHRYRKLTVSCYYNC
jgi:hypothetical protein